MAAIIVLAILAFLLFVLAFSCIKIVRPYQRGVVERLGRYKGTVDPGLRIIVPFVDRVHVVDMREQVVEVPAQEVITSDNVVVSVYAIVYHEATDAKRLMYNVANFELAVTKLAQTNLRNLIGDLALDDALTSSAKINTHLRDILDDSTDKWGVRVVRVEIQRIDPPPDVVQSMHHQMQAERTRRAVVTEALGVREAAITRAEGEKQAAILEAQGQSEAITTVFKAIHDGDPDPKLLAYQYLQVLPQIAQGDANKVWVIPSELTSALGGISERLLPRPDDKDATT